MGDWCIYFFKDDMTFGRAVTFVDLCEDDSNEVELPFVAETGLIALEKCELLHLYYQRAGLPLPELMVVDFNDGSGGLSENLDNAKFYQYVPEFEALLKIVVEDVRWV